MASVESPYLQRLKNRITLGQTPFSERGSRLMIFRSNRYLSIRLAERWFKLNGELSAYRERSPLIDEWVFTDGNGQPLEMRITTYPHCIDISTAIGAFSLVFIDTETILILLPAARCGMEFSANLDKALPDRRGCVFHLTGNIRRNIACTTNAHIVKNLVEPHGTNKQKVSLVVDAFAGAAVLINITPRLGFNRYIPDPASEIENAARRWHEWFDTAPPVIERYQEQYYYAWWVMRSGLISSRYYTTREAMTPSKPYYVGIWQWDAYFHSLAYRHIDKRLAQDQLRVVLDHQREDGMIPDAIHDEGLVTRLSLPVEADVTKPPLVAWAAWKLYQSDGDREFLEEIYEPIVRWNRWWFEKNDLDGDGLCEYQHPFSSGLDDSPLWDEGMPVTAPDLNTYLCVQQDSLAKIARIIGERKDASRWLARSNALARRMIQYMWDDQAGVFWAAKRGKPINVLTPFSLLPLFTGRMPSEISDRLVSHLIDEHQFWSHYPVPTVALNDPHYTPFQMWRGPTWANVNYLLVEGLQKSGFSDLAQELRYRTLDMIAGQQDIYEYYHPETGENPPKAAANFGWSSAVFIDLAIQATLDEQGILTKRDKLKGNT